VLMTPSFGAEVAARARGRPRACVWGNFSNCMLSLGTYSVCASPYITYDIRTRYPDVGARRTRTEESLAMR